MSKYLMLDIQDLSRANEYALDIARTGLVKESLRKNEWAHVKLAVRMFNITLQQRMRGKKALLQELKRQVEDMNVAGRVHELGRIVFMLEHHKKLFGKDTVQLYCIVRMLPQQAASPAPAPNNQGQAPLATSPSFNTMRQGEAAEQQHPVDDLANDMGAMRMDYPAGPSPQPPAQYNPPAPYPRTDIGAHGAAGNAELPLDSYDQVPGLARMNMPDMGPARPVYGDSVPESPHQQDEADDDYIGGGRAPMADYPPDHRSPPQSPRMGYSHDQFASRDPNLGENRPQIPYYENPPAGFAEMLAGTQPPMTEPGPYSPPPVRPVQSLQAMPSQPMEPQPSEEVAPAPKPRPRPAHTLTATLSQRSIAHERAAPPEAVPAVSAIPEEQSRMAPIVAPEPAPAPAPAPASAYARTVDLDAPILDQCRFFHKFNDDQSRHERRQLVDSLMETRKDGDWLMRYNTDNTAYILVVRFRGRTLHIPIQHNRDTDTYQIHDVTFPDIVSLLNYYHNHPLSSHINVVLQDPVEAVVEVDGYLYMPPTAR